MQRIDNPGAHAYLAASYGHLGQSREALEALANYRSLSPQPVTDLARSLNFDASQLKLFLDGIALAEGKSPADGAAGTP